MALKASPPHAFMTLACLLALSSLSLAHALPSLSPPSPTTPLPFHLPRADPIETCGFEGDDNTYGLGIRLGLYLQWLSTMACNVLGLFEPEEARSMKSINLCFQASVFGGLLDITITRGRTQDAGQLYAAEIWVILCLCIGGVLTVGPEPAKRAYVVHDVCQQLLNIAMSSYAIWFAFTGMDQMAHPPCSHFTFFFARVDMYHWFRQFWKVVVLLSAAAAVISFAWCVVRWATDGVHRITDDPKEALGRPSYFFRPLFVLGSTIASTELIIRWNHIGNVNAIGGTGQLIPLIVACLSFVRLVYKLYIKFLSSPNSFF
ncbi:hypothetical protein FRB90_000808, partial [Tulasnella sp. 427]